jgi:hypothetical protein
MKFLLFLLSIIFFTLSLTTCKDKKIVEMESAMQEWMGRAIIFPDIMPTMSHIRNKDTLKYVVTGDKYKIVLYIDSIGCTKCKIGLQAWKAYIREVNSEVDFLFYFHPKNEKELIFALKNELFNYPIYFDRNDELNKFNHFPTNPMLQCFLLDKNNKVLAIGNPANNPQIWMLYKEIISGEVSNSPLLTTVETELTEIELKNLHQNKTSETVFTLKNTGTQPMIIQMVNTSCGCTVPEWEKQPVLTGKSTEIKVKITPEEKSYFSKTITVHCNTEEGRILLKISGMVE